MCVLLVLYLKNLIGIFLIYKFKIDSMKQAIVINEKNHTIIKYINEKNCYIVLFLFHTSQKMNCYHRKILQISKLIRR